MQTTLSRTCSWQPVILSSAQCDPQQWNKLLLEFEDASVYQTPQHDLVLWGRRHINHFFLRRNDDIVAAAQVRVAKAPGIRAGIAYVLRGPLWQPKHCAPDPEAFRYAVRSLRQEFAVNQGLLLRIVPNIFDTGSDALRHVLAEEGFTESPKLKPYRTFLMDLTPSLDELHRQMRYGWRRGFNKTSRMDFSFTTGTTDALFAIFLSLYEEMHDRKQFTQYVDVHKFRRVQMLLPESLKLHVTVCWFNHEPVAACVCDITGKTALLVFLATSRKALQMYAAHALMWEQIRWLKTRGILSYDLGGIDPEANPGGYQFKSGPGGQDTYFIGPFEACTNAASYHLIRSAQRVRSNYRRCRELLRTLARRQLRPKTSWQPRDSETPTDE